MWSAELLSWAQAFVLTVPDSHSSEYIKFYWAEQPTAVQYLAFTAHAVAGLCINSIVVPRAPGGGTGGAQGAAEPGRQRQVWGGALDGSSAAQLLPEHELSAQTELFSVLQPTPACSFRRKLLSPGVGLQPHRNGIYTDKNMTSGAFFGCSLTVFRTRAANKSRCLSEASSFYFN